MRISYDNCVYILKKNEKVFDYHFLYVYDILISISIKI